MSVRVQRRVVASEDDFVGLISPLTCRTLDDVVRLVVEPLARHFSACSHIYFELEEIGGELSVVTQRGNSDTALFEQYGTHYYSRDPLIDPFLAWLRPTTPLEGAGTAVWLSRLRTAKARNYQRSFLARLNIGDILGVGIPIESGPNRKVCCLGLHRRIGSASFNQQDANALTRLIPMLRLMLENLVLRQALEVSDTILTEMMNARNLGYAILDQDLVLHDISANGGVHLGLGDSHGTSSSALSEIRRQLLFAEPAAGGADGKRRLESVGRNVTVEAIALRQNCGQDWWLLLTSSDEGGTRFKAMCHKSGLTTRQEQVAQLTLAGGSTATVSCTLGISVSTTENHLRSIYRKLGISRRTQLAAKFINFSAEEAGALI